MSYSYLLKLKIFAFSYCPWGFQARILEWVAIYFSHEPDFVKTLHYNQSILHGPEWHGSEFH